ncbi:hypothetical protein DAPPUDRAFT_317931 [Daphnia pulex]|uniref:Uncharacterized protein n=1 Tax=Daphnia pulex TaxID=6669 RepID=E9GHD5_DAPPU|nr:hypothetical protein DAPPUDRAFT_317931 [Daphnia pulex]|eukprot:EFX81174.1 hypothetical protein DAPPUDRAFT_317931 [Daphnia pulex]
MDIIFSPVVRQEYTVVLKVLIMPYFEEFRKAFPSVQGINKLHHMFHYPQIIRSQGPPVSKPVPTSSDSNSKNHVSQKICEKVYEFAFDVEEILNSHEEGVKIVEKYQADVAMPVTEVNRNTIIHIALGHVIRIVGHYYPEASTKAKLAAAIVAAFSQMGLIRDGLPTYTYIYNSATGNAYIDQHLKRMRKVAFTTDQRKRKSVEKPKDDARKGKGKSLKKSSPAEQPLSDEYVAECYLVAKLWCFFGKQIEDYVHQYPKTSDIGTFMSKYENRLIRLALYNNMEIQESTDAFLKVLVVCAKYMPRIQQVKSQLNTTLQQIVIFLKKHTNLEEFVKNKPKHLKQPFLVCLGTLISPKQFFLVLDFYIIDFGIECSNAFNVLFSSFFAFNTEYPKPVLTEF